MNETLNCVPGGNQQLDEARARRLVDMYFGWLVAVVRRKMSGSQFADGSACDVVNSTFGSFFDALRNGRLPQLETDDEVRAILYKMTIDHLGTRARKIRRIKHGGGVQIFSGLKSWEFLVAEDDLPDDVAEFKDHVLWLLELLPGDECRTVALMTIGGYSQREIAQELNCHSRTVQRSLALIRRKWKTLADCDTGNSSES